MAIAQVPVLPLEATMVELVRAHDPTVCQRHLLKSPCALCVSEAAELQDLARVFAGRPR